MTRASIWSDDQIDELLSRLEEGEALSRICRDPRMPAYRTVYSWLENGGGPDGFDAQFRAARARGIDAMAEECIEIADEDVSEPFEVQRNRLRVDTRLRLAGKWWKSKYGEGLDLTTAGEKLPAAMDEATAATRLSSILQAARAKRDAIGKGASDDGAE